MELSQEDSLRLNVLLTQDVKAIRINESSMTLYALLPNKEAKIQLHPTFNDERYLRLVRELLASHYIDSPAGFPVFMSRWTRMQQSGNQNLDALLKLGEAEAVVYVVNSPDLTVEQASYAWWAIQSSEVAVELLKNENISQSTLGENLRDFLLEFLPFENNSTLIIRAIHLLVSNNLLSEEQKKSLLVKGNRKAHYLIGLLHCDSQILPGQCLAHPSFEELKIPVTNTQDSLSKLGHLLSAQGQNYLSILNTALNKFSDQESIIALFQVMQIYFQLEESKSINIPSQFADMMNSLEFLSTIHETQLNETLSHTNAVGTVLRKQLRPVCQPILHHIEKLMQ